MITTVLNLWLVGKSFAANSPLCLTKGNKPLIILLTIFLVLRWRSYSLLTLQFVLLFAGFLLPLRGPVNACFGLKLCRNYLIQWEDFAPLLLAYYNYFMPSFCSGLSPLIQFRTSCCLRIRFCCFRGVSNSALSHYFKSLSCSLIFLRSSPPHPRT